MLWYRNEERARRISTLNNGPSSGNTESDGSTQFMMMTMSTHDDDDDDDDVVVEVSRWSIPDRFFRSFLPFNL
jgi:hypothetical protein